MPTPSYIVPILSNVSFKTIVTVGEEMPDWSGEPGDNDGPFVGIPDGIGAFDNGDGTITVLLNHELRPDRGSVRDHGSTGAFVERIIIDKATLAITASDDLASSVQLWDDATDSYVVGTTAFNRFCSSDLPEASSFYNASSGLGSQARIYLTGEEAGPEGRAFAMIVTGPSAGTAYELPFLGNISYENVVANPYAQDKTVVAVTDDTGEGQIYIYVGQKQAAGSEIQKAGLDGGALYGIKVDGLFLESAANDASGAFTLELIPNASNLAGAQIETASDGLGVTGFMRPEDLAWDPDQPNVAYFVTTASFSEPTRLYRLEFNDITNPAAGGTIELLIDGSDYGAHMFDNLSVENGKVVIQEDPGNNAYLARTWEYDIDSGGFTALAQFDPAKFVSGLPGYLGTQDEESSGVIDVTDLLGEAGTRAYLVDAQVHKATDPATTVEMGQLSVMYVEDAVQAGGNGNDSLEGNGAAETFNGQNGNDVIVAWGGNDAVNGGNGNDRVLAGTGNDIVNGDRGDDWLEGGFGNDTLNGGLGADWLVGGGDLDQLTGGQGGDFFVFDNLGETGDDLITDFSKGDLLLTTAELDDTNGLVDVSDGLALFGSSEVDFGNGVTALKAKGTIIGADGNSYHAYALASGGGTTGGAFVPSLDIQQGFPGVIHDYLV